MTVAVVVVGGIVLAGADNEHPTRQVRLFSGAAWLASSKVGQVTLLDGVSAEVAAQVQVAPPGNALDVVQHGAPAYAIDQTAGTVRRVDGATFALTPPVSPIPDAHAGLTAIPARDVLYTVDTRRGILARNDPLTLAPRGELLSLAGQLATGTVVADDAGTLWAIDTATGDLTRVTGETRSVRRQVARPGRSVVTVANGHPVVVDTVARKVIRRDGATGGPRGEFDLDLRADDTVQVSGSPHADRLYVVISRGVLDICDLAANRCDNAIPLTAGSEFGAAVEAGNRLFVPEFSTGQVWIVDLARSQVIAKPTVLNPAGRFQLLTRDGVVFYNDTESERVGVIRLDGTVSPIAKYDPKDPAKGITVPPPPPNATSGQRTSTPTPSTSQPSTSQASTTLSPTIPPTDPDDPAAPTLEIVVSKATPTVDEPITLQVNNSTGPPPAAASWTFGDGEQGTGVITSHKWATARSTPYLITVIATLPDGRQATTSVNLMVTPRPTVRLAVDVPGGGGTVSGGGISCPGVCSVDVEPDTQLTLTAAPDANHLLGSWGGACAGTAPSCEVIMNGAKNVGYTFVTPTPRVTLSVTVSGGGTLVGGPINCPGVCTATVDVGTRLELDATSDAFHDRGEFGGACDGAAFQCNLTMTKDETVSVVFPLGVRELTLTGGGDDAFVEIGDGDSCPGHALCIRRNLPKGRTIALTAHDGPNEVFDHWEGSCTGSVNPCQLTMNVNHSVKSVYRPR